MAQCYQENFARRHWNSVAFDVQTEIGDGHLFEHLSIVLIRCGSDSSMSNFKIHDNSQWNILFLNYVYVCSNLTLFVAFIIGHQCGLHIFCCFTFQIQSWSGFEIQTLYLFDSIGFKIFPRLVRWKLSIIHTRNRSKTPLMRVLNIRDTCRWVQLQNSRYFSSTESSIDISIVHMFSLIVGLFCQIRGARSLK